jgi:uncharacterized protein
MQRPEREITDRAALEDIIRRAVVCRLGLVDGSRPYVVPMCFGYEDGRVYFHSALRGTKLDLLRANDAVCVEFDGDLELITGPSACACGMRYRSVIAFGHAAILEKTDEKRAACDVIMAHYADGDHSYSDKQLSRIVAIRIDVTSMTGKQSGY